VKIFCEQLIVWYNKLPVQIKAWAIHESFFGGGNFCFGPGNIQGPLM